MGNVCFGHVRSRTPAPPARIACGSRAKKSAAPAPPRSLVGGPSSSSIGAQQALRATGNGSVVSCPPGATGRAALSDDCAIDDLLEGRMDLRLVLPDGREVHVNVERRTPVMDLLVQVATAHKINPSGHLVQAPNERGDMLTCKPNTAIGSLDVSHLLIVPKGAPAVSGGVADPAFWHRKGMRPPSKPFEPTQRIQVRLPRQQLMVLRLPLTTTLGELRQNVCTEKSLDPQGYQLVRPGIPTRPLDLTCTLQEYGASEVTLLSNRTLANNIQNSTADIMSYSLNQENKRGSQVFPHHSGSKGSLTGSSSDGASSRGTSPTRNELPTVFARPTSKKRPAPPPPLPASPPPTIPEQEGDTTTLPTKGGRREGAGHSRQSSDSSGYHEASVLSDLPDTPSPEAVQGRPNCSNLRQESPSRTTGPTAAVHRRSAPVETGSRAARPQSTISEAGTIGHAKKRKAPPPPPLALHTPAATQPAAETTKPASTQPAANPDVPERLAEPSSPAVDEKGEQLHFRELSLVPPPSPFSAPVAHNHLVGGNPNQGPVPKPRLLTIPLWQPAPEDNGSSQYDEAVLKKLVFSHIDATFDSIEDPDSLAADNSACVSDSASWEYTIPEPPSPFRTRAGGASETSAASQSLTKTESLQPESPKSDLSRDDSGLVDDLGSRDCTASTSTETQNIGSRATGGNDVKCEKKDASIPVTSATTTVIVESVVLKEAVLCQGSVKTPTEETVKDVEKEQSEPSNEGSSSETSSLSAVTSEEHVPMQSNIPDQDQESDESASMITNQPMPRRDSLQIYRLKEVKVSTRQADASAAETHNVPEPALETSTCKVQEELPSSVPEEEVFVRTVVVNQGQKGGETKTTVQTASLECFHSGPCSEDAPKGNCTVVENAQGKSRELLQTGSLDRQELVKMSSYPNAAEKTVHIEEIVWEVSDEGLPVAKKCEASAPEHQTKPIQRQEVEKTSRPRSVVGGPISFSIGSLGSYKTEVVDDIYSGDCIKPNYERFKNIKVISPSSASSGAQRAVTSKVAAGPAGGSATLTRPDGKQASEGDATFTVKIGSWESDNQALKQSSKQSVSTADLRPSHSISQVPREAGHLQFEEEKDILLSEYARLQEQFVAWTQQLESNQNLLEDKRIVPSAVAPSAVAASQQPQACSVVNSQHEVRVSTLPRVKPMRPLSLIEERSRAFKQPGSAESMTAPVVSFGTWKDQKEDQRATTSASTTQNRQRAVGGSEGVEEKVSKSNKQHEGSARTVENSGGKPQAKPKPDMKKPTGILYSAPVVRGFSLEAIEKLSQEASLQQKLSQSQDQATHHEELSVATSVQQLQSRPSDKGRVTVTNVHASSESSTSRQQGGVADRRSLPPYLQSEIVRLAKKPSATSEQHLHVTENAANCSNNKPSIVQATLKSGVTVEPLASAHSVVKVNGHASAVEVKQAHSTNQPERSSAATVKRSTSECDGPRKLTAGGQSSLQSAPRNPQASVIGTRDILMDEIRNFGGKGSLKKVSTEPAWQLNVCGLRSA